MNYKIIRLGRDFPGKITNFAEARNSFIEQLKENEWILFIDDDAEASQMLLDYLDWLKPPENARYYSIRTLNLINGEYQPLLNPFFWRMLVSNKVHYEGRIHEKIHGEPTGLIDYPIIHNHQGSIKYSQPINRLINVQLAVKKVKDIMLKGHYDPRVL